MDNQYAKYEHQRPQKKEKGVCDILLVYVTLTFDSKFILMIWKVYCNPHAIGNQCVKYECPRSKYEGGINVTSKADWQTIGTGYIGIISDFFSKVQRNMSANEIHGT